jgi:hypothetical protein
VNTPRPLRGVRLLKQVGIPVRANDQQTRAEIDDRWQPQYLREGELE